MLLAALIAGAVQLVDDSPLELPEPSAILARVDKLSPAVKAVYARPGKPPAGVPRLGDEDEVKRCGDPERLLELSANKG